MFKNRKMICALLLCLLMVLSVAMVGCQENVETTTAPCTAHSDANKDGKCDNCGIQVGFSANPTTSQTSQIEVSFEVFSDAGKPMEGAIVRVKDNYDEVDVTATVGADGTCKVTVPRERYIVSVENLPNFHLVGFKNIDAEPGMEVVKITVMDNTPTGEMAKPFFVGSQPVTKNFAVGQVLYFSMRGGEGRELIIENPDVEVQYQGQVYSPDADGKIAVQIITNDPKDTVLVAVTNKGDAQQDITLDLYANPGTVDNPYEAVLNQTDVVKIVAGGSVYYEWVATADGSLTVTSSCAFNSISLTNTKSGDDQQLSGTQMAGPTEGAASVTLEGIQKGDIIRIQISVTAQAGDADTDVDFTLSFA